MPEPHQEKRPATVTRGMWSGVLSFGLVSIPVELHAANRSSRASLRLLAEDGTPLERHFVCPEDGEEVPDEHLSLAREVDEKTVIVTDEELAALNPKKSREIDLRLFVAADELDPLRFERCYFLVPSGGTAKAYQLLAAAMERSRRAGIATFVMRDREYLVAIFAEGGVLRAETMRFDDEVRSPDSLGLPEPAEASAATLAKTKKAVSSLSRRKFSFEDVENVRSKAIESLVAKKRKNRSEVAHTEPAPEPEGPSADVIDLFDALKRSIGAPGAKRDSGRKRRKAG